MEQKQLIFYVLLNSQATTSSRYLNCRLNVFSPFVKKLVHLMLLLRYVHTYRQRRVNLEWAVLNLQSLQTPLKVHTHENFGSDFEFLLRLVMRTYYYYFQETYFLCVNIGEVMIIPLI
jgi:hypothetical protein